MRPWAIRCIALAVLAIVLWQFGPRAWSVLPTLLSTSAAARPSVDLDRVGVQREPHWLAGNEALRRAVYEDLSVCLRGRLDLMDSAAATELAGRLNDRSWVERVEITPGASGLCTLRLVLRRPVLEVQPIGRAAQPVDGVTIRRTYVTAAGVCLLAGSQDLPSGLPFCRLAEGPLQGSLPHFTKGEQHPDPRVLAAAAVAVEWRDALVPLIAPSVADVPRLVEVDASNLNHAQMSDVEASQVRIGLARRDGSVASLSYGRPPGLPLTRVALADKAEVLRKLLAAFPGLTEVERADLRFVNLWRKWVVTR